MHLPLNLWERPTVLRPARSPLGFLQNAARCGANEAVRLIANPVAHLVHRFGNLIRSVPRHVFTQRRTENLTSRLARPARETFNLLENLLRNGNCGLHTVRITAVVQPANARLSESWRDHRSRHADGESGFVYVRNHATRQ